MERRTLLSTAGSGLATAALLAGALLIVGSGPMIAGIVGVLAGTAVAAGVFHLFEQWPRSVRRVVSGYGAFGIVFSVLFVLATVVPGADSYLITEALVGAGLLVAAVVHGLYYTAEVETA